MTPRHLSIAFAMPLLAPPGDAQEDQDVPSAKELLDKMDAAFEFFTKIGAPYYCFHDIDVVSEGASVSEYESNMQTMVEYLFFL